MNAQLNYNIRVIIKFINYSAGIRSNIPESKKSMRLMEIRRIDMTHFFYIIPTPDFVLLRAYVKFHLSESAECSILALPLHGNLPP